MIEAIRQGDIPGVQLRRRAVVPGSSPDRLWPFLVEPARMAVWLADRVEITAGSPVVFSLERRGPDEDWHREHAEVLDEVAPSKLLLGFRELGAGWQSATALRLELGAVEAGCEVMVFQEGFQQLPLSIGLTAWERSRARWTEALERLAEAAGSTPAAG